jgi:hypothetical protein
MTDGLLCQEDGLSPCTGSEFPWLSRLLGRVGCHRSWYCVAVEIPLGNPGSCAHSFDALYSVNVINCADDMWGRKMQ